MQPCCVGSILNSNSIFKSVTFDIYRTWIEDRIGSRRIKPGTVLKASLKKGTNRSDPIRSIDLFNHVRYISNMTDLNIELRILGLESCTHCQLFRKSWRCAQ